MKKLRDELCEAVKGLKHSKKVEATFVDFAFKTFLAALDDAYYIGKPMYDKKNKVQRVIEEFCSAFMACIVMLRTGQDEANREALEKTLASRREETQINFIDNICAKAVLQDGKMSINIISYFLLTHDDKVVDAAVGYLLNAGKFGVMKSAVVDAMECFLPELGKALVVLVQVDNDRGVNYSLELASSKDESIRLSGLRVLASSSLSLDAAQRVRDLLQCRDAKKLWDSDDHRGEIYGIMKNMFANQLLDETDKVALLKKAFRYEGRSGHLRKLLELVGMMGKKKAALLSYGFIAMERSNEECFGWREEQIKKYVTSLSPSKRKDFLCKALMAARNDKFFWFAGQQLISSSVGSIDSLFIAVAKRKNLSLDAFSDLMQLVARLCDVPGNTKWSMAALNGVDRAGFVSLAVRLLHFAEGHECPHSVRVVIGMNMATHCKEEDMQLRASNVLQCAMHSLICTDAQMLEVLRALLHVKAKNKALGLKVDKALYSKLLIDQEKLLAKLLHIVTNDIRSQTNEVLYAPVVEFLAGIDEELAVPLLEKALAAEKPDGDLGMCARAQYIDVLKKIAIKGNARAVDVIAGYYGGNIWNELLPDTLLEIYKKTASVEVMNVVLAGVARRFIASIGNKKGVAYFYEFNTVKALMDMIVVQDAYLVAVEKIGTVGIFERSPAMRDLIKELPGLMPASRQKDVSATLTKLIKTLQTSKEDYTQDLISGGRFPSEDSLKDLNSMSLEASLALAGM